MPLQLDDAYRGPHAVHVHPHQKLGKHRSVIEAALPLINWLIDDAEVNSISFGKLVHASGTEFTPRVECTVTGLEIKVLLVEKSAAQSIRVFAKKVKYVEQIATRIKTKWSRDILGAPKFKVV